jgi:hypothetical protein
MQALTENELCKQKAHMSSNEFSRAISRVIMVK